MGSVDLGAAITITWSTAPTGGTYAVATIAPDGSTGPTPTATGTPPTASFVPTMAGRWLIRWTSTVVVGAYTDIVDVWPADPLFIISLDDAKNALAITAPMTPANAEDLRLYIAAATPVIEDIVGAVVMRTITQTADGNQWAISLWEKPTTILTVTEGGGASTILAGDYVVDYNAGIISAGRVYAPRRFMPGFNSVTITYTAGMPIIPPNIRLATRELVRHMWQLGHQSNRAPSQPQMSDAWTPSGFAVPRRVMELCSPNERIGGFA